MYDVLVNLCNRYGVTLLASDIASGKKGAALAYGITEYESGSNAAQKALEIFANGFVSEQLSITAINNFRIEINKNTAKLQNLNISSHFK